GLRRPLSVPRPRGGALVFVGGVALGIALWHVAGAPTGDGLFHLARVRKLVELGDLHLRTVDEFKNGGLHPGYAFPLWHAFEAMVAKISGLDSAVVVNHEESVLAPIASLLVWESGLAVFDSVRTRGGAAEVCAGAAGVLSASLPHRALDRQPFGARGDGGARARPARCARVPAAVERLRPRGQRGPARDPARADALRALHRLRLPLPVAPGSRLPAVPVRLCGRP